MIINQWVPAAHRGDAIGDSARRVRDLLRGMGHDADLYALTIDDERLKHPPTLWCAAAALAESLYAAGDDPGAEAAFGRARATIDAFTEGLSDGRKERFLAAPQLAQLLAFAS